MHRSDISFLSLPLIHHSSLIIQFQEEIYSSLKKVRATDDLNSNQLTIDKHITMIPLGSPHELHRETTANGTMIRVSSGYPQKIETEKMKELVPKVSRTKRSLPEVPV